MPLNKKNVAKLFLCIFVWYLLLLLNSDALFVKKSSCLVPPSEKLLSLLDAHAPCPVAFKKAGNKMCAKEAAATTKFFVLKNDIYVVSCKVCVPLSATLFPLDMAMTMFPPHLLLCIFPLFECQPHTPKVSSRTSSRFLSVFFATRNKTEEKKSNWSGLCDEISSTLFKLIFSSRFHMDFSAVRCSLRTEEEFINVIYWPAQDLFLWLKL